MIETENNVILVDIDDLEIGICGKLEAHKKGLLHRAFSIFLINNQGELLLQQRASNKYHSPNLWSNACCSHPFPSETISDAAVRRLKEELSIGVPLNYCFHFNYYVEFENGLVEHEIDHVLIGRFNELPEINPQEAIAYCWISLEDVQKDMKIQPEKYTFWFKFIIENYYQKLKEIIDENL